MKLPKRRRLVLLGVFGLVVIASIGLSFRKPSRGVDYYFPTWYRESEVNPGERFESLTNVSEGLPIALAALKQKPSKAGGWWSKARWKLPDELRDRLPTYEPPQWGLAMFWLAIHADELEVAREVTNRWRRWPEVLKGTWIAQDNWSLTNRGEYLSIIRETVLSTNKAFSRFAAVHLAAYPQLSSADVDLLAAFIVEQSKTHPDSEPQTDGALAKYLAQHIPLPERLISALESWRTSTNLLRSARAALVLASVAPERFPLGPSVEEQIFALTPDELRSLLYMLGTPKPLPVSNSNWGIDILLRLLARSTNSSGSMAGITADLLWQLSELGSRAAGCVQGVLPLLDSTNSSLRRIAAYTFATVAPQTRDSVAIAIPYLTNSSTAAPLLLWLSSLGTNASPALLNVAGIANGTTTFPLTEVAVPAAENCPRRLVAYWPDFEKAEAIARQQWHDTSGELYFHRLFNGLPPSNLAELARRCLTNIAPERVGPLGRPDDRSVSPGER